MISVSQIKQPRAPVVCSDNGQVTVVDPIEDTDTMKLAKDGKGKHQYIPMKWVTSVDDKMYPDRPGDQAMLEWLDASPGLLANPAGMSGAQAMREWLDARPKW